MVRAAACASSLALLCVALALMSGCCPDGPIPGEGEAVLEVSPLSLSFPYTGGQETFEVRNIGDAPLTWASTETTEWLSVTSAQAEGSELAPGATATLQVTCDLWPWAAEARNGVLHPRTAEIAVTSNGGNATVAVSQAHPPRVSPWTVEPDYMPFPYLGGEQTITITNNGEEPRQWVVTESMSWLSVSPASGTAPAHGTSTVTVTCDPNGSSAIRETTIMVISEGEDLGTFVVQSSTTS